MNFAIAKSAIAEMPPILVVALRFGLIGLLMAPFFRLPRAALAPVLRLSVAFGVVHFSVMYVALAHVDAAVAAIAIQIQVPFAAILSALLYKDPMRLKRIIGMVIAVAGVALLMGEPRTGSEPWAIGLVITAALIWTLANMQMKALSAYPVLMVNGWMALFSAPMLALVSLIFETDQIAAIRDASWIAWGSILYQAFGVFALCYSLWYTLLRRYSVNAVMPFTLLVPAFGVLGGVWILGEPMTWSIVCGGVLTLCGVAIIQIRRPALARDRTSVV